MKAVILKAGEIRVEDVPSPVPGEGEALIRVLKAGICNTDLELLEGYMGFEGIPGHEFTGQVVAAPEKEWEGTRVTGEINIPCGNCEVCHSGEPKHCPSRTVLGIHRKHGVFAQYATLPLENLHALPPGVSDVEGVFIEPLAAALAIFHEAPIDRQGAVLVMGDGKLGLLVSQAVQTRTPHIFCVGRHRKKLALLAEKGIRTAPDPREWNRRFDVVVEATGNAGGIGQALRFVKPKGVIVAKSTFHGLAKIDYSALVVNEVRLIGSRCGSFADAIEFMKNYPLALSDMVEADFPLEDAQDAFDRAKSPEAIKVLLTP